MFSMRFTLLIALMGMLLSSTLGAKLSYAADVQHSVPIPIPIPSDEPVHPTNMTTTMTYTISDKPTPSLPFGEPHHISVSLSPPRPHKYHNSSSSHHVAGIVTMVGRDLIPQGMGERRIIPTPPVPSDEPTHSYPPPMTMNPSSSSSTATNQPCGPSSGDPYHWPNSTATTETTTTTTQTVIVMPTGFPFPWPTSYNGSQPHYNTTCWVGSEDMPCRGYLSGCTTRGMLVSVSPFASDHH